MAKKKKVIKKKGVQGVKKKDLMPVEDVIDLIKTDACAPYTNALANILGWGWYATRRYINSNPELQEAMDLRKTELIETAENVVSKALKSEDEHERNKMAKWVLSVRNSEYKEKKDISLDGSITLNIKGLEDLDI